MSGAASSGIVLGGGLALRELAAVSCYLVVSLAESLGLHMAGAVLQM